MPIFGPKINTAFTFYMPLRTAGAAAWKSNPTIAAGDFNVSKNGGAEAALTTTPTVMADTYWVKFALSASEMNSPIVQIRCHDVAGAEWDDTGEIIVTTTAGSGSGVVVSASATLVVDTTDLANQISPILVNAIQTNVPFLTSTQTANLVSVLALNGTTGGLLNNIKTQTDQLAFTSGAVQSVTTSFSSGAQTSFKSLVFQGLTDSGNTIPELSAVPSSTPTPAQALMLLYQALRNGGTTTSSQRTWKKAGGTTFATQSVSIATGTTTFGVMA